MEQVNQEIRKAIGLTINDIDTVSVYIDAPVIRGDVAKPPQPPYFLMRTKQPINRALLHAAAEKNEPTTKVGNHDVLKMKNQIIVVLDDRSVLMFPPYEESTQALTERNVKPLLDRLDSTSEVPAKLKEALELAQQGKHHAVLGFQISQELGDFLRDQLNNPNAPPMVQSFKPLTYAQGGFMALDYGQGVDADFQTRTQIDFADAAKAEAGLGAVKFGIGMIKQMLASMPNSQDAFWSQAKKTVTKILDASKVEVNGSKLVMNQKANSKELTTLLVAAIEKVRTAADRMISGSNMRQLMIAMHNFHADYAHLPEAATTDKNGKPLLSWRVTVLPYIEQDELYKKFKLDEPWDSPHNKAVLENNPMPKLFEHPAKKDGETKKTYYKLFVSKKGVSPAAGFTEGQKITLGQLTVQDGTSNTVAMVETGPPIIWTKPEDIDFDPTKPFPKLVSVWKEPLTNAAFFDGSVRQFKLGVHEDVWKAVVTRNGGEEVDFSKIEK
jgi:hypothetical protein